ncbi:serine/threonine-protein kinase RIO3-like isoform X2 [Apostichopus japonicus]|uniref:serine/threonine-protein kinase RIO3-like isoform X2 n=1 Tax=Stichopus japonicus TaxID=307972 RepID=UPI003AB80419
MEAKGEVRVAHPSPNPVGQRSPWGTPVTAPEPCSLAAVMDEEFAKTLQIEEEAALKDQFGNQEDYSSALELGSSTETDTSNDMLLAQMLQLQFDREHDNMLAKEEAKYNGESKVSISWSKYKTASSSLKDPDYEEDDVSSEDDDFPVMNSSSSMKKGMSPSKSKSILTKHDAGVCGKRNASRVMEEFPPEFASGKDLDKDIKLSNSVYNSLKLHSLEEEKKSHRVHEKKEHSTVEMAVDPRTRILLFKLVNGGILESINGTISTGKEAVVIHASGGRLDQQIVPVECALKVFKTTLNEFKNRQKYIKDDYRFKDRFSKQNPRRTIRMWAEKEMHNLNRMREAGIRTPDVILLKKHILVMTFIGENQKAAPKLKDVPLSTADKQIAYEQCLEMMERLYQVCNLVHADLSEYNMLWHQGQVWFIDVSQSVEPNHPHGLEFLLRDCTNVSTFFSNIGVHGVLKPHELFNRVTKLDLKPGDHQEFLAQIESLQKFADDEKQGKDVDNFAFDYFFEQTRAEQEVNERSARKKQSADQTEREHLEGD